MTPRERVSRCQEVQAITAKVKDCFCYIISLCVMEGQRPLPFHSSCFLLYLPFFLPFPLNFIQGKGLCSDQLCDFCAIKSAIFQKSYKTQETQTLTKNYDLWRFCGKKQKSRHLFRYRDWHAVRDVACIFSA